MDKIIKNRWDEVPYADSNITPLGDTPDAGSWPMYFFKKDCCGGFTDNKGNPIAFNIKRPEQSDGFSTVQLEQVKYVAKNLTVEQKAAADYWGEGVPQNQIVPIVQTLLNTYKAMPTVATRIYSILDMALNDTMVMCWYYKFLYQVPRPEQYDSSFKPYLKTPMHPSYPAGHSVVPGCVEGILSYFFPTEAENIRRVCQECSISRLYGGVHYIMDLDEGYKLGYDIAYKVIKMVESDSDKYGSTANMIFTKHRGAKLKPPSYCQVNFEGE